ncbi:hypothetical protein YC2023_002925 [Brassica napus]
MLGRRVSIELGLSVVRLPYSSLSAAELDTCLFPSDNRRKMCKLAGFLKILEYWQRDKFWDLVSRCLILCLEMLETSALGLGQDLGFTLGFRGCDD